MLFEKLDDETDSIAPHVHEGIVVDNQYVGIGHGIRELFVIRSYRELLYAVHRLLRQLVLDNFTQAPGYANCSNSP